MMMEQQVPTPEWPEALAGAARGGEGARQLAQVHASMTRHRLLGDKGTTLRRSGETPPLPRPPSDRVVAAST
jgi:hypothetical protein